MGPESSRKSVEFPEDSEDNWKHRSSKMKCKTCMWSVVKTPAHPSESKPGVGRCRRHAPTLGGYPVIFVNDWCGDHKLDENKVANING